MNNFDYTKFLAEGKLTEEDLGPKGESITLPVDFRGDTYTLEYYKQDQGFEGSSGKRAVYISYQAYTPEGELVDWDRDTYEKFLDIAQASHPDFKSSDLKDPVYSEEMDIEEMSQDDNEFLQFTDMDNAAATEAKYYEDSMDEAKEEVFTDVELDMASEMLRGMFDKLGLENNVEKSDALVKYINAWFETNDFVNEAEEVEVKENEIKNIKSNKMTKTELKEMIKSAIAEGDNYYEDTVDEEMRKDDMDEEMRKDDMDEEMKSKLPASIAAAERAQIEKDARKSRGDIKEDEDVEVEDNEDIDVDIEKDVKIDDEESEVDIDVKASMPGESEDVEEVQALLMKAQQAAADLGDDKLMDQIGNTITYFTRSQVARVDEMDDLDVNFNTTEMEAELGLEEEKQGYNDELDDSEGAKHGKKKQSMAQRRADSENMEKAAGKRKYSGDKSKDLNESMFPMWNKIK